MNDTVKTVLLNYAICAFVGGMLEYISPEKIKKNLRVAVVSVLLFCVVAPVVKSDYSIDGLLVKTENNEEINYNTLMHTANLTERKIREEMKEILINEGVSEYEIYISTSVDEEENTVYLDKIKIEVGKAFKNKISNVKNKVPEEFKSILEVGVKNE